MNQSRRLDRCSTNTRVNRKAGLALLVGVDAVFVFAVIEYLDARFDKLARRPWAGVTQWFEFSVA
jgi:hypothetical protein